MKSLLSVGRRYAAPFVFAAGLLAVPTWGPAADNERPVQTAQNTAATDAQLAESVKYLASDRLEGRGIGTAGINLAADYVAAQFAEIGLKTQLYEGTPFQRFSMTTRSEIGDSNELKFIGPKASEGGPGAFDKMTLGTDFSVLLLGGTAEFDLPLVFAGYGITAPLLGYDDYAGLDAKGKAVIILRHEPQQDNADSPFNGKEHSEFAPFMRKVSNAYEHGAGAVIFVTDQFEIDKAVAHVEKPWRTAIDELAAACAQYKALSETESDKAAELREQIDKLSQRLQTLKIREYRDPLMPFDVAGKEVESRQFPVLALRRSVAEKLIQDALGESLGVIEKQIDEGPKPHSRVLEGWRAVGRTSVKHQEVEVKNVVAVLEGEGPHADETIVVGAHYDHLGYGGNASADPGSHEIHNGADDNASGVADLLQVARELAGRRQKLPRRIVFLAFTGEERGLIGSARYVKNPLVPLDQTIAMLNMDMVGRLQDDKLIVSGTGTAEEFGPLLDTLGKQWDFAITRQPGGFGPSDHSSFYAQRIPVLHFFTGSHKDYHRPSDDFDKLNIDGMRRVAGLVTDMAVALAEQEGRLHFLETKNQTAGGGGDRPYFGSVPDFAREGEGYGLSGVTKDGPAERGGLKAGDLIIQLGESKIGNLEDFDSALRKHKAGDKVPVVVRRGNEDVKLEVVLDPPK